MKKAKKKTNHITINLNDNDFLIIKKLAEKERRNLTEFVRLVLVDATKQIFINSQVNKDTFKKAIFKE